MKRFFLFMAVCLSAANHPTCGDWKAADIPIMTRWGQEVTPENAWTEYPRPQLIREDWQNLNGLWDYQVAPLESGKPGLFGGQILVPYPIESALSGVLREISEEEAIWYQRSFTIPGSWREQRILLNLEAADWETQVWINGQSVGSHRGGYDPFSFDITEALAQGDNQIVTIRVWDPQNTVFKSLGKQANREEQYTGCSGIWGTVWLEPVPETAIRSLKITPSSDGTVTILPKVEGPADGYTIRYEVIASGQAVYTQTTTLDRTATLEIQRPRRWSPDDPFLYDLGVYLLKDGEEADRVKSYFGLRSVGLRDSARGKQMTLNGEVIFQMGPLDQNYWPGGGLTPPSDEAMAWECQYLKNIGCNMVRLHIKQNPRRWYYHCDRLGLLVWQDFISAIKRQTFEQVSRAESDSWLQEQEAMVDSLYNHPSIIKWIVFNEAWGQHDTERILEWAEEKDASRIISVASGWYDLPGAGDIRDIHDYSFYPAIPVLGVEPNRAVILGECGGFAGAVPPHNWTGRSNSSGEPENLLHGGFDPGVPRDDNRVHDIFRPTFTHGEGFENQYSQFVDSLVLLKNNGLTAAIYTQMTDMKLEENGWLTFDRAVSKMDVSALRRIHGRLYRDPPSQFALLDRGWKYHLGEATDEGWTQPGFDDHTWKTGNAPFGFNRGEAATTGWRGGTLLLRKTIHLASIPGKLSIRIISYLDGPHRSEWIYTKVYLNGRFVQDDQTRQFMPESRVADIPLWPETAALLKPGENTLAVEVIPGLSGRSGRVEGERPMKALAFDFNLMAVAD